MPRSAIPGFVKKRTATQQYNRSPRQLTRDVTIALEMRDEKVLPHLKIRTEEGESIDGTALTTELVKKLLADGRNPMWYFRKDWLESAYGLRSNPKASIEILKSTADASTSTNETSRDTSSESLIDMMQETIRELRRDKEILTDQLKTNSDRWMETNHIAQGLSKRIEAMEERFELNNQLVHRLVQHMGDPPAEPKKSQPQIQSAKRSKSVPSTGQQTPSNSAKTKRPNSNRKKATTRRKNSTKLKPPKWYQMPTFKSIFTAR